MITFEQALRAIRLHVAPSPVESVELSGLDGRVLAQDVLSCVNLPGFDNSAMDGFALSASHRGLPAGTPIAVDRLQAAGDAVFALGENACQIMTGAAVPEGTDTVVPVEQVDVIGSLQAPDGMRITLHQPMAAGQNIRRAGEDINTCELLCTAGTVLSAKHVMLFAAIGVETLAVRQRIKAAVLCTGAELVSDGAEPLLSGQIRNSNGPYLKAQLKAVGVDVAHYRIIADQPEAYREAVEDAERAGCRLIVSTGAVSMGVHDFVPETLRQLGAEIIFHKLGMRPAKPTLFARLPSGVPVFGLPGNPMSCAVGLRFFVQEAIRSMHCLPAERPIHARLQAPVGKKAGWQLMHKALLNINDQGQAQVSLLPGQESFRIKPFAAATAWALLPAPDTALSAGHVLACYPLGGSGLEL